MQAQDAASAAHLSRLLDRGYDLLAAGDNTTACDAWLQAWEILKQLITPDIRTCDAFDQAHPTGHFTNNWCNDLDMELSNVSFHRSAYHERRLQFAREFVLLFPDEDLNRMNFMQAIGDSLWGLGQQAEAEAVYADLMAQFPDKGWAYVYASDSYWLMQDAPKDYAKAETILLRGLDRATIDDRDAVLERLRDLYDEWDKPELRDEMQRQLNQILEARRSMVQVRPPPAPRFIGPSNKPGRNDPCWCGSGKKYKYCHLRTDEEANAS